MSRRKKPIYKKPIAKFLFEQEEEETDLFGDTDEGDDADTADDTEGDDTDAADDAEGDDTEDDGSEEEEEKLDVDIDDEVKLSKSVDQDLEALLIDFETDARKSKQIDDIPVEESLNLGMLIEQDEYDEDIDLERFAAEVARLVKNYTTLLDMEKILVSKSREFIVTRYGEDAETDLVDILSNKHDIDIQDPPSPKLAKASVPIAVGAGTGGAGGTA
jgi:hypothetical protein